VCATTVTYAADADAWIDQGSASDNKGEDSTLKVMSKAGSNLRALVHFAVPARIPDGCVVQSATLAVYADSASSGRTLQAWQLTGPWNEGTVTWANQPATTGTGASSASGTGYRRWNVTTQVQASFDAGVHHGFLIRDAVENQDNEHQFHSREKGANPPQLVITYAPAPTTTTTAPTTTPPPTTTIDAPTTSPPTTAPSVTTTTAPTSTVAPSTTQPAPTTTAVVPSTTEASPPTTTTIAPTTTTEVTTTTMAATPPPTTVAGAG
jgi:hypothetical protein